MDISIDILVKHKSDLNWMVSDQANEFDDYLLMPIRERDRFQHVLLDFLKTTRDKTSSEREERLRVAFNMLADSGEDLVRLSRWLLSMKDTDGRLDNPENQRENWEKAFKYWYANSPSYETVRYVSAIERTVYSYRQEVYRPYWEFDDLIQISDVYWRASDANRSEVDNFLFETHYEDIGCTPGTLFGLDYLAVKQRSWFHNIQRSFCGSSVHDELLIILKKLLAHNSINPLPFRKLAPLEIAFGLNEDLLFEDYCRDW